MNGLPDRVLGLAIARERMRNYSSPLACFIAAASLLAVPSPQPQTTATANVSLSVTDLSPKFLALYEEAVRENASPDVRWELWKKLYHFAAVPPTPEGEKMARMLFDQAWPRYPSVLEGIRGGAAPITPVAEQQLKAVAELLRPDKPVHIELLIYVGDLEDNAFTVAYEGQITTAIPIESPPDARKMLMTHEFTHALQIGMGSFSGNFKRTVGAIVLTEGLASRVTQKLFPDRPETDSIEFTRGWLKQAEQHRVEILRGIHPFLTSDKPDDIERFTIGPGPAGLEREAYYVGWLVIGDWLAHGMSFADIARIPEKEMPQRVTSEIDAVLAAPKPLAQSVQHESNFWLEE